MKRNALFRSIILCAALMSSSGAGVGAEPLTGSAFLGRPAISGGERIAYGTEPSQFGTLWMPSDRDRPPIVMIVHGGCWSNSYPDLSMMNPVAADLQRRGFAVWNVEYRRTEEAGGGWPGTYQDLDDALAKLAWIAQARGLDGQRLVIVGYSAGAQLALIAAKRLQQVPNTRNLGLKGIVSLGGILDLERHTGAIAAACGAAEPMARMIPQGGTQSGAYAKVSPAQALPIGFPVTLFQGVFDTYSPPYMGLSFMRAGRAANAPIKLRVLEDSGHFDMIAPDRPAWREVAKEIRRLLERP